MTDHYLTGPIQRARGVIGRYPADGDRYIFRWSDVDVRDMRMLGVTQPLLVTWIAEGDIIDEQVLQPIIGKHAAVADTVIEQAPPRTHAR